MRVNLKSLIGRLDEETRKALEAAAGLCLSRTHYDVEIEHYLEIEHYWMRLLDATAGDRDRRAAKQPARDACQIGRQ